MSATAARVDAVLPAGGRIDGAFAEEAGAEVKALLTLDGRTVLERTIEALRATGRVERIVVIGADEVVSHPAAAEADNVLHSDPSNSGPTNILRGMEWLREARGGWDAERALVVTTDLPFLTSGDLQGFIDAPGDECDISLPLISREEFEGSYPGSTNFYVKLRDGEWTMGCAFLVNPQSVERNRAIIESAFQARKSQMGMARLLGIGLILRFVTKTLTVAAIESRCRRILGCSARAVRGCSPALAFDIDTPEEYRYVAERFGRGLPLDG